MPQGPENYAGKLTQAEIDHINTLTRPEDIAAYLHDQEVAAGLRSVDPMNPDVRHEVERVAQLFTASITVDGKSYTFSGDNQADVDRQQIEFFKSTFSSSQPSQVRTTNDTVARTADGRFAREERQPSLTQGLDDVTGGLVAKALAAEGISLDDLKAAVAEKQADKRVVSSWAQATIDFKNQHPDWEGGENMVELIGTKLAELGLTNQPSARSIQAAYDALVAEATQYEALRDAKTPEEIKTILGTRAREEARIRRGNSY